MSKAGKRVLILEQHDQAGGCCHTFIDKGYEFDVGIHYIGKFGHHNINKTLMDQICEGQVEWNRLEDEYDIVSIGKKSKKEQNRTGCPHFVFYILSGAGMTRIIAFRP